MSVPDPPRSAREELREQLLQAAHRQADPRPGRRRRRRRGATLGAVVVLGAAAAAGAADLISTGDPVPDTAFTGSRYKPAQEGAPALDAVAKDPGGGPGWGVGLYTSEDGQPCAVVGQVRGLELGKVRDGVFHRYERGTTGACGDLKADEVFYDVTWIGGLTLVFGRTRYPGRRVIAMEAGNSHPARPGRDGGFVYVFRGKVAHADIDVVPE